MNLGYPAGHVEPAYMDDVRAVLATARKRRTEVEPPSVLASKIPMKIDTPRSKNDLRPERLKDLIGQDSLKSLLRRLIHAANWNREPFDHMLLVGSSGVGKTTVANAVANELGVRVFSVEAPVSHETLLTLREQMDDRDILFIDEIHQQAIMERRGRSTNTQPEVLFGVMEDRTLVSGIGVLEFPAITIIGATTDEGMLPDPFVMRFPIRPHFDPYSVVDLALIAKRNGEALGKTLTDEAAMVFAYACRGVPRQINSYVRNARSLAGGHGIGYDTAKEVVEVLNRTTQDGLTLDMQKVLTFLYERCQRTTQDGDVVHQASVNTIATAIGKSRDTKAVALRIEPYLIEQGYLQVGHGGRKLTDAGIARALELIYG